MQKHSGRLGSTTTAMQTFTRTESRYAQLLSMTVIGIKLLARSMIESHRRMPLYRLWKPEGKAKPSP